MKYIDMHCDTITDLYKNKGDLLHNNKHIDIEKLQKGECLLQNFAIFTNIGKENSKFTYDSINYYYEQLNKYHDYIVPVKKYGDILENEKNHKINAMLTLEEGSVIDNDLNNLDRFYDLGVRMITLTWNYSNGIGHPNIDYFNKNKKHTLYDTNDKDGLTDFGIEFVKKCNKLGIIVDVSHLSDKGFEDVCIYNQGPFVASHSNARKICPVARNLTDEMIVKLARKGGVMGLNYCSEFIEDKNSTMTYLDRIVDHARHIVQVGGIDVLGLGSDFDGIGNGLEFKDAAGIQKLYIALKAYFSEDELEKIFYKNVLRVYQEILK